MKQKQHCRKFNDNIMYADRSSQSSNSGSSKLRLMAVLIECSECLIYREEFYVGNEVRGLSCAHNLLIDCIDDWLRLNVQCPRFCCSVFPNLVPSCYPPSGPIPNSHSSYIFQVSQFRASLRLLLTNQKSRWLNLFGGWRRMLICGNQLKKQFISVLFYIW